MGPVFARGTARRGVGDPKTVAIGVRVSSSQFSPASADFRRDSSAEVSAASRPAITRVLSRLKRQIRGYVLFQGAALLLILAGSLFWLSLALDWACFRLTALELPLFFREAVGVVAVALFAAGVLFWIVLRWFAAFRPRNLALVLERRFPQLGTRLVTAVELAAARSTRETPLTSAMIDRTIDEAARISSALPLESVFNPAPRRRALIASAVFIVSVAGLAIFDPAALARWERSFVRRAAVYWPRQTQLVVKALVQPGDRVRVFQDGRLKHPRGGDLVLLVEAAPGSKIPASVELNYFLDAGRGSGRVEMVKTRQSQFRHTISGLLDSLSLWVSGGDYVSREPLRVEVVDPPRVDRLALECDHPDYTRLARDSQGAPAKRTVEVQSSQVALPMETAFRLLAQANKPLVALRIESETRRITLSRDRATIAVRSATGDVGREEPLPLPAGGSLLSADGLQASIPFLLTAKAAPPAKAAMEESAPGKPAAEAPAAKPATEPVAARLARLPITFPPDCRMRWELEDTDGITSVEPIRISINGVPDQPPAVQTELRGISSSITRKATIPVTGTINDDYGIAKAQFEFRVDKEKEWHVSPFRRTPAGTPKEFFLRREESDNTERFEVLPLDLKIGQRLTLSVVAQDGAHLNGPDATRGEEYVFQIVSDDELLSLLFANEVHLRAGV